MRRTVLAREERLALKHLREDAACRPDINRNIVLLPREHDLWCAVVPCRDIARHLRVLYARQTEVADLRRDVKTTRGGRVTDKVHLEITVFIHKDVARFLDRTL